MATVEWGAQPVVRFSNQPLAYEQTQDGGYYENLRKLLNARFDLSENHHASRFEKFYRFEKLVHMVSKKRQYDWKANVFLPYAFSLSEQSAAVKWLALFLTRPYVTVQARVAGLDEIAVRRQALLDWHFTGDVDLLALAIDMFRQSERYGKSIAMIAPKWDRKTMKFRSRMDLPTAYGPIARYRWKMDEKRAYKIVGTVIDLTDFFGQPHRKRINGEGGMDWCFYRDYSTMDDLLEAEEAKDFGPEVGGQSVVSVRDTHQQDISDYKLRRMSINQSDDQDKYRDPFDQIVEKLLYVGRVPRSMIDPAKAEMESRDGRNPYERLIVMANRHAIIEDVALPWDHGMKPFVEMDCVPDPYDFWGKGKIEPVEHLNYVGNELANMRLDNVKQLVNGLLGVDGSQMPAGWKRKLMSQPGGVIETKAPPNNVIQRIQMGDVTQSSYTEQQQVWTLAQEADAVNETMLGSPGPQRTLGEHQLKLESSSKRLQFELVGQAKQLMGFPGGFSAFVMGLDRQYLPISTYIRVVRPETPDDFTELAINPEDFEDEDDLFAYYATGATEGINSEAKRANLAQMLQALAPFGQVLAQTGFNFPELVKVIIKTFGHDPGRFFPKIAGPVGPEAGVAAVGQAMGGAGMPGMPPGMPGFGPQGPGGMGGPFFGSGGGGLPAGILNAVRGMPMGARG
jgi:hypothetical protein